MSSRVTVDDQNIPPGDAQGAEATARRLFATDGALVRRAHREATRIALEMRAAAAMPV
jgi:hypothetical protein